jgi:outer membrane beta-barrel protein
MVMGAVVTAGLALAVAAGPTAASKPSLLRNPAPRPTAEVRVQNRFATKAKLWQLYGGVDYLSRGDFYTSPGARVGATYYLLEPLGVEVQVSHFWSSLDDEAQRVRQTLGAIPDSHAPGWLALAGARYSIGYGKLMVGGVGGVIHFEPQAFAHAGVHDHDGDVGPSADLGLGLLFFLTPRVFTRLDAAVVYERETRSGHGVAVLGILPALTVGGTL